MPKDYIQEKITGIPGQILTFRNPGAGEGSYKIATLMTLDSSLGISLHITAPDSTSTIKIEDYLNNGSGAIFPDQSSTGEYNVYLPRFGTWKVTATNSTNTKTTSTTLNITQPGNYYTTLQYFESYISVTFPQAAAYCTCVSNDSQQSATAEQLLAGYCQFVVGSTGDYVISMSNSSGTKGDSKQVSITSIFQTEYVALEYTPDITLSIRNSGNTTTLQSYASSYITTSSTVGNITSGTIDIEAGTTVSLYAKSGQTSHTQTGHTTTYLTTIGVKYNGITQSGATDRNDLDAYRKIFEFSPTSNKTIDLVYHTSDFNETEYVVIADAT